MAADHLAASAVGQKRRVDVDDPRGKRVKKLGGQNQHPAGKDDQIGFEGTKHLGQPVVIRLTHVRVVAIGKRKRYRGHPSRRRSPQRTSINSIADDDGDLGLESAAGDGVEERLQVRPGARGENCDPWQA